MPFILLSLLRACFRGGDDHKEPRHQETVQTQPRRRWDDAPPLEPGIDTPAEPPPYAMPIVVEAFQSQGCNSCPPTNTLLLSLLTLSDPNILVLDYHVTYWDHLGWKDPFGIAEADARQREYAEASGTSRVYTPQVIVNGVSAGVGNSTKRLEKLIKQGGHLASQDWPWLLFSKVEEGILIREASPVAATTGRKGKVFEIIYDPAFREVSVPTGENAGKVLPHRNVVKSVIAHGDWSSARRVIPLAARNTQDGLERVLMVQEGGVGGQVIGIARIHF